VGERERKEEGKKKQGVVGVVGVPSVVGEVLTVLHKHIPGLVKDLLGVLVSEEAGRKLGEAVGAFYKELREAGIAPDEALKMAKDYMESLVSLGRTLAKAGPIALVRKEGGERGEEEQEGEEAEEGEQAA